MIGSISGVGASYGAYHPYPVRAARPAQAEQSQNVQKASGPWAVKRSESLETPVQPVRPVRAVDPQQSQPQPLPIRQGADPVEMAVRMRIQYLPEDAGQAAAAQNGGLPAEQAVPGQGVQGLPEGGAASGVEGVQQAAEEGKCETCEQRKYQDGSDDMGVSFQTPTRVDPDMAASAVRGHEMEHVVREQAKAQREDRRVVSQSVTLHTDICPECGKAYISGGTTRTTTASKPQQNTQQAENTGRVAFSAVA